MRQKCQRCGGDLVIDYGEVSCLLCSAPHNKNGNLLLPVMVVEDYIDRRGAFKRNQGARHNSRRN